jgi:hypothetical protein
MTAYELADWLDNFSFVNDDDGKIMSEISEKLRGQQSRLVKAQELVREYTALCMRQQAEINALSEVMAEQNFSLLNNALGNTFITAQFQTNKTLECAFDLANIKPPESLPADEVTV